MSSARPVVRSLQHRHFDNRCQQLRPLLDRGWRIDARDTFMASEPDLLDPIRLLPDPSLG